MSRIYTGMGFWDVWAFLTACGFLLLLAKAASKGQGEAKEEIKEIKEEIKKTSPTSVFWELMKSAGQYYRPLLALHNGIACDLAGYFVVFLALFLLAGVFL